MDTLTPTNDTFGVVFGRSGAVLHW